MLSGTADLTQVRRYNLYGEQYPGDNREVKSDSTPILGWLLYALDAGVTTCIVKMHMQHSTERVGYIQLAENIT